MHSFIYIQLQIYIYIYHKNPQNDFHKSCRVSLNSSPSLWGVSAPLGATGAVGRWPQPMIRAIFGQWTSGKNKLILWNKYGKKGWKKKQTNQTKDVQYYTVIDEIHDIHCTPKSHGSRMIEVNHGGRMWAPYRKHNPHFGRGQLLWDM